MIRYLAIAVLAAALLPTSAEARKFRTGGGRSGAEAEKGSGATPVVTPRIGRSSRPGEKADAPARPPFPPSSAPTLLRVTTAAEPKVWCRSEVVVGGFCVVN